MFTMSRYIEKMFALCVVLTMQTIYMKLYNSNLELILSALCVILIFILNIKNGYIKIQKKLLNHLIFMDFMFLLIPVLHFLFLKNIGINISATLLISILCIAFFNLCVIWFSAHKDNMIRFGKDVIDIIFVTTLISMIFYIFGQTMHIIKPSNLVTIQWGGNNTVNSYYYLLFTPQAFSYHNLSQGRFTGIFTEAPMFAFMLCVALIGYLFFYKDRLKVFKLIVLGLSLYFTGSTTGYIIGILSTGMYVVLNRHRSQLVNILMKIFSVFILMIVMILILRLYQKKITLDVGSVTVRSNNFQQAMIRFFESPIYGHGFKSDALGTIGGDTSVITQVFQQGGMLFGSWYFIPIIKTMMLCFRKKYFQYLIVIILYCMMLYTTVITYTPFSIVMIALFLVIGNLRLNIQKGNYNGAFN